MLLKIAFIFLLSIPAWAKEEVLIEASAPMEQVQVKRGSKSLSLKVNEVVEVGDEISTAANQSVDLRFPDASLIRIGANSKYKLESVKPVGDSYGIASFIQTGFVRAMVKQNKDKKDIKFRMRTPTGTIGVRGTEFLLSYKPERKITLLQTLQGEVLVGPADCDFTKPNTWVKVAKGEESTVSFGGTPTPAKKFNLKKKQTDLNSPDAHPEFAALANRVHGAKVVGKSDGFQASVDDKKVENAEQKPSVTVESAGAKLTERQSNNKKLVDAVINKQSQVAIDLLNKGADPNQVISNESRDSLLHGAVVWNDLELTQALIDKGARVNVANVIGNSALMELVASKEIKLETIQLLFENEINVLILNKAQQSALDLAKANTDAPNAKEVVEMLTEETKNQKAKLKKK